MSKMKPILFSTPMILALLEGRKTNDEKSYRSYGNGNSIMEDCYVIGV